MPSVKLDMGGPYEKRTLEIQVLFNNVFKPRGLISKKTPGTIMILCFVHSSKKTTLSFNGGGRALISAQI